MMALVRAVVRPGLSAPMAPPLATVTLPHHGMGHAAASYLLDMIQAGDEPVALPETVRLDCVPVVRESLGSVPIIVNPARA
jgi:DNA-binding LacI/PurR family transcriptional regulator